MTPHKGLNCGVKDESSPSGLRRTHSLIKYSKRLGTIPDVVIMWVWEKTTMNKSLIFRELIF